VRTRQALKGPGSRLAWRRSPETVVVEVWRPRSSPVVINEIVNFQKAAGSVGRLQRPAKRRGARQGCGRRGEIFEDEVDADSWAGGRAGRRERLRQTDRPSKSANSTWLRLALGSPRTGDWKIELGGGCRQGILERSARSHRRRYRPSMTSVHLHLAEALRGFGRQCLVSRRAGVPISVGRGDGGDMDVGKTKERMRGGGYVSILFAAGIAKWQGVVRVRRMVVRD